MSREEFCRAIQSLRPYTDYLYFHLMGEPLLHPLLSDFLALAGELGFRVILTTNGTLLPEREALLLDSECLHKINISLQSFEANEGGDLQGYAAHCAAIAQRAGERGKLCVLRLWNGNGQDRLNDEIRQILSEFFPEPWPQSRGSMLLAPGVFLEPGEKFDWPDREAELQPVRFCQGLRDQIGVLADGTVVPCCLDHEGDLALGNLFSQSMEEILSSERAERLYRGFSHGKAEEELCRRCGYAARF